MNLRKVMSAFDHLKVLKRHRFMKIGSLEAVARKVTFPDGTILVNSKRQVDSLRVLLEIQGSKLARPVLLFNKSMGWDPEMVANGFQYELVPAGPRPGRRKLFFKKL